MKAQYTHGDFHKSLAVDYDIAGSLPLDCFHTAVAQGVVLMISHFADLPELLREAIVHALYLTNLRHE